MTPDEIKVALSKNVTVSARRKLHIAASRKGYVPFRDAAYILESAINTTLTTALMREIRALRYELGLRDTQNKALSRTAWAEEVEV